MLTQKLEKLLKKAERRTKTLQFAMNIPDLDVQYSYSSTSPTQRFHSASVGKLMTATLIFIAVEQEKLTLETRVGSILEQGKLDGLFVFENTDFQGEVTVKHLLKHMSGINDYFESKTFDGSLFTDDIIKNPDTFWTPIDLLNYTRNRQQAIARPGQKFFYSDTGYILLGLIIEELFGMSFHQALDTFLFQPAGMQATTLCFYGDNFDQNALAPMYINGVDVHLFRSLSCDFSGGGLSTTAKDLLRFVDHLQNQQFISQKSLDQMADFDQRYRKGLYYGCGMMQVRFEEFFFLLKGLPQLQGHLGVSGVHAWYDPTTKATFVLNVGNTKDMVKSFKLLIQIMQTVQGYH